MERIIICGNKIGSYTYHIEVLELFDKEEMHWARSYRYWTSKNKHNSYFADVILIMNEIEKKLILFEEDITYKK